MGVESSSVRSRSGGPWGDSIEVALGVSGRCCSCHHHDPRQRLLEAAFESVAHSLQRSRPGFCSARTPSTTGAPSCSVQSPSSFPHCRVCPGWAPGPPSPL